MKGSIGHIDAWVGWGNINFWFKLPDKVLVGRKGQIH